MPEARPVFKTCFMFHVLTCCRQLRNLPLHASCSQCRPRHICRNTWQYLKQNMCLVLCVLCVVLLQALGIAMCFLTCVLCFDLLQALKNVSLRASCSACRARHMKRHVSFTSRDSVIRCCSVLQCVAMCCSALQMCCSVCWKSTVIPRHAKGFG